MFYFALSRNVLRSQIGLYFLAWANLVLKMILNFVYIAKWLKVTRTQKLLSFTVLSCWWCKAGPLEHLGD